MDEIFDVVNVANETTVLEELPRQLESGSPLRAALVHHSGLGGARTPSVCGKSSSVKASASWTSRGTVRWSGGAE